jgi:DNA invertase Pin-like site-specific DNA recombinase
MESAVIYARKSDPNATTDDESFENQEDACRKYAQSKGYSVLKVYRESHSGADLLNRPKIWEAIDDIRHGDAQVLLVRNFDRLARRTEHSAVIRYEITEKAHGRVEAALDSNEEDSLAQKILDVVAEAERQNAVARMERGKRRRAERGHLMGAGSPLFGYAWLDDEKDKRTTYTPDPDTAPIVQRIFQLVTSGNSLRSIAKLFNTEGVKTPSQWNAEKGHNGRHKVGEYWSPSQIQRLASERTYTGDGIAYRWQLNRNTKGGWSQALRDPNDDKSIRITVPPLVDKAIFDAAQQAINARETAGRPPVDTELSWLRGHVYCGCCGAKMHIHRYGQRGEYRYRCQLSTVPVERPHEVCPGGSFTIYPKVLEKPVYEALAHLLTLRNEMAELMVNHLGSNKIAALMSMSEGFEAQLKEKREELDNARSSARQTKDMELRQQFISDAEVLNDQIHALETEYAEARGQLAEFTAESAWVQSTLDRIYNHNPIREIPTPEDVKAFPLEARRLLLAASGLRAEVYPVNWTGERQGGYSVGPKVEVGPNGKTVVRSEEDRKRVEVFFAWSTPAQQLHSKAGARKLSDTGR